MTNEQPEPCLGAAHCASPVACNAFGYCRERNFKSGVPDAATQAEWRKLAAEHNKARDPVRGQWD